MTSRIDIVQITPNDVEEVARFLDGDGQRTIEGARVALGDPELLQWFLFDNPAPEEAKHGGWTLRTANGRVVGALLCAPQRFRCGESSFTVQTSSTYYVEDEHRGRGLPLFMRYFRLGNDYPLLTTTANRASVEILERFGAYAVPGTDREWVGVSRWSPVLEEWLNRRFGHPGPARLLAPLGRLHPRSILQPGLAPEIRLQRISNASELDSLALGGGPQHANRVTAVRDAAYLRWRYFEGPDRWRSLFRFDDAEGRAGLVGARIVRRGYRQQIGAATVLDLWGSLPEDGTVAVASRLAEAYAGEADIVVFRGLPEEQENALERAHFLRWSWDTPVGWCVDRRGILPSRTWYLVPADGDTAF